MEKKCLKRYERKERGIIASQSLSSRHFEWRKLKIETFSFPRKKQYVKLKPTGRLIKL